MKTILISGGTGMIGKALTKALLEHGFKVIILTRQQDPAPGTATLRYAHWDPVKGTIDRAAITEADHIIHLAGAGVADKRWTKKRKKEILDSRVQGSRLLADSLRTIPNHVKTVVSASAIGWYGADPSVPNPRPFTEGDPPDESFLGQTCHAWEQAMEPIAASGIPLVTLRIGIVLAKEGGAFAEFRKPLSYRVAAILGNGRQVISWIHIDDLVALFLFILRQEKPGGIYNAVAPEPVPGKTLILSMAKAGKKRYMALKVPAWLLRMILGEMSIEILKSTTVNGAKVRAAGFQFRYATIAPAVADLMQEG